MTTTRPLVRASVVDDHSTLIHPDGSAEHLVATEGRDLRATVVDRAMQIAASHDTEIELVTSGDLGDVHLLVTPTGRVSQVRVEESPASLDLELTRTLEAIRGAATPQPAPVRRRMSTPEPVTAPSNRPTFIDDAPPPAPATTGWRRLFGMGAGPVELARIQAQREAAAHWPSVRRIAVVNGKGGVGKTMTTACLAAVYGRFGGGGVLAWDNNPTRGSLGWRTESAPHGATVQHVLQDVEQLSDPNVPAAALSGYVHHQADDKYDVLRSNPQLLAISQRVDAEEFDALIKVIDRAYRLVIFDSGNDESAERWLRMIDHSHQLVIPTTTAPEAAESALLLLEELHARDAHSARLAARALIVVTDADRTGAYKAGAVADQFAAAGHQVMLIPFDAGLKSGQLRFDTLRQATQDAWVRVAAAAVDGL